MPGRAVRGTMGVVGAAVAWRVAAEIEDERRRLEGDKVAAGAQRPSERSARARARAPVKITRPDGSVDVVAPAPHGSVGVVAPAPDGSVDVVAPAPVAPPGRRPVVPARRPRASDGREQALAPARIEIREPREGGSDVEPPAVRGAPAASARPTPSGAPPAAGRSGSGRRRVRLAGSLIAALLGVAATFWALTHPLDALAWPTAVAGLVTCLFAWRVGSGHAAHEDRRELRTPSA